MSVPAWKQAIFERRKKQEDDQKKKQAEEEAHLANLPPWKRALFQKREKEKQQQLQEKSASSGVPERSNSFVQRQQQERDGQRQRRVSSPEHSTQSQSGWGRRATPPLVSDKEPTPPTSPFSPSSGQSGHFFGGAASTQQRRPRAHGPLTKRASVTILPGVDDIDKPLARMVANAPIPHLAEEKRPRSSSASGGASQQKKVVTYVKKSYEEQAKSRSEVPAWKKALLERRKEKEMKTEGGRKRSNSPKEPEPPLPTALSLPIERMESPPEVFDEPEVAVPFKKERIQVKRVDPEPVSLLVVKRHPSPEEVVQEQFLPLQRKPSPIEQVAHEEEPKYRRPTRETTPELTHPKKTVPMHRSAPERAANGAHTKRADPKPLAIGRRPSPIETQLTHPKNTVPEHHSTPEKAPSAAQPKKSEPKPLTIGRRPSPIETVGAKSNHVERSDSPTGARNRVSSTRKSQETNASVGKESPSNEVETEQGKADNYNQKLIPRRSAPAPPKAQTQPQRAPPKQRGAAPSRPPARQRPVPEVVNRRTSEPPMQSQVIQTEGVTHRAPVYKEVNEWANVSVDDPKFRSLPTWKQALIKRRRADVAKRTNRTTSVDDIPVSNGPVPNDEQETEWNPQGAPSEDQMASMPPWKKQMMQRKAEGSVSGRNVMSSYEKKLLANKPSSPTSSSSNVKALLGRFNKRSPSPPSPTSTTPRSPSPSSGDPNTRTQATSSRPAYSPSGIPQPSSPSHHTRKSFTWTPGDDSMPDEALSDDDSSTSEEGGQYAVTRIDDTSSAEEDSDGIGAKHGGSDSAPAVVLLRPPQAIVSPAAAPQTNTRKKNSILVSSTRPKTKTLRRVAFSDTELVKEHQYPKYDYSDYEDIQEDNVTAGFSFSFWKSKEEVESAEDEQSGLSHRLHPSLRSPEPDPDSYRYSPSVSPVSSPPSSSTSPLPLCKTTNRASSRAMATRCSSRTRQPWRTAWQKTKRDSKILTAVTLCQPRDLR